MVLRILKSIGGFLVAAAVVLGGVGAAAEENRTIISARAALEAADAGEMIIIDVRSPLEWRMTGIPEGAVPVTIHNPGGAGAFLQEVVAAVEGDRSRPIALICAGGARSGAAQALLQANDFTYVRNLHEGMQGSRHGEGWLAEGLPVEPCPRC